MQAESSAEPALDLGNAGRLALLGLNALPMVHVLALIALALTARPAAFAFTLLLLPPLLTRAVFAAFCSHSIRDPSAAKKEM